MSQWHELAVICDALFRHHPDDAEAERLSKAVTDYYKGSESALAAKDREIERLRGALESIAERCEALGSGFPASHLAQGCAGVARAALGEE